MKFLKRIKYFGFGFVFGLIFVFFLFKDRDFKWAWLPGNRVTNFIINHPIKLDSLKNKSFINSNNFTNDLYSTIINGEVDFSSSDTKSHLKQYIIKHLNNVIYVSVSFKDSISQIMKFNEIVFSNENYIDKEAPNLNMDNKTFYNLIISKEKKITSLFLCQLKNLNLTKIKFEKSLYTLKIKWNSSKPYIKPYGFYIAEMSVNHNNYYILLENSSEKIRFKSIQKTFPQGSLIKMKITDFNKECE